MRKIEYILMLMGVLFIVAALAFFGMHTPAQAQIVPGQNQIIPSSFFGDGYLISTSSSPTHKLGAAFVNLLGGFVSGTTTLSGTANQVSVSNNPIVIGSTPAVLSLPSHVVFPGSYFAARGTTTNATSTELGITGNIRATNGSVAIDIPNRQLYNAAGDIVGNWDSGFLASGSLSVDWANRTLYASNGSESFNYGTSDSLRIPAYVTDGCLQVTGANGTIESTGAPCGGSGGGSTIATSSTIAVPQLAYFTSASPTEISGVSTTTLAGTGAISVSNSPVVIGGTPAVISCSTCLTAAVTAIGPTGQTSDGPTVTLATSTSAFNGLTPTLVITGSGDTQTFTSSLSGTLGYGGGGTGTTTAPQGQILYGGPTSYQSRATTTLSGTGVISVSNSPVVLGNTAAVISCATCLAAAVTSIGPAGQLQTGPAVTIATSTAAFNGLTSNITVTGNTNTLTIAPTLSGTLGIGGGGTGSTTAYDTGLIFYNSTLGTYSQASRADSNHNLNWDRTTPGLGIGSTTPWGLLSVNQNGQAGGVPSFVVGSSTGTSLIVTNAGRVGMNDVTPDYRLESVGTLGSGYFGLTNSTDGDILNINTLGAVGISSTTPFATLSVNPIAGQANNQFAVGSSTATAFKIDNSGQINVGTTTAGTVKTSATGELWVDTASAGGSTMQGYFATSTANAYIAPVSFLTGDVVIMQGYFTKDDCGSASNEVRGRFEFFFSGFAGTTSVQTVQAGDGADNSGGCASIIGYQFTVPSNGTIAFGMVNTQAGWSRSTVQVTRIRNAQ